MACNSSAAIPIPGIPHLDPHRVAAPLAPEQDLALPGIFDRVAEQVADHLRQQRGIAMDQRGTRQDVQQEVARLG